MNPLSHMNLVIPFYWNQGYMFPQNQSHVCIYYFIPSQLCLSLGMLTLPSCSYLIHFHEHRHWSFFFIWHLNASLVLYIDISTWISSEHLSSFPNLCGELIFHYRLDESDEQKTCCRGWDHCMKREEVHWNRLNSKIDFQVD